MLGNQVFTEMMHGLCSRTTLIIAFYDTPRTSTCSYREHEQILDLLEAGDAQGAKDAMCHHLLDCEQRMNEPSAPRRDPWAAFSVKR